jgi:biopolymer transport protein ExbB/biopolymer transport protein TolQ
VVRKEGEVSVIVNRLLRLALVGSSWVLYLLIALSVVSIAAMVERWLYFRRHRDDTGALRRRLAVPLRGGDLAAAARVLAASPSLEARVLREAIRWTDGGAGAVADAIDSELFALKKDLERGMALLGTLGTNAPFIGLLGTVLGVIEAFHQLGEGANKAAMGNVMSGIAEALVATGVGLFVALPAVVAYNLAQKRIGEVENGVGALGKLVTAALKTHPAAVGAVTEERAEDREREQEAEAPRSEEQPSHGNGAVAIVTAYEGGE